eukprot:scaffold21907_cov57-Phaeocystis_antarctica.AAC.3
MCAFCSRRSFRSLERPVAFGGSRWSLRPHGLGAVVPACLSSRSAVCAAGVRGLKRLAVASRASRSRLSRSSAGAAAAPTDPEFERREDACCPVALAFAVVGRGSTAPEAVAVKLKRECFFFFAYGRETEPSSLGFCLCSGTEVRRVIDSLSVQYLPAKLGVTEGVLGAV